MDRLAARDERWLHRLQASLWLIVVSAFLAVYLLDLRLSYPMLAAVCEGSRCHYQAIGAAEAAVLAQMGLPVSVYALYMLGATVVTVAIFVVLARIMLAHLYPQGRAFLFSLMLVVIPLTAITSFDVVAEAFPAWAIPINLLFAVGMAIVFLFFLVFPNGQISPRWTIIFPLLFAAATPVWQYNLPIGQSVAFRLYSFLLPILLFSVIVYRYRRLFNQAERQQARWVLLGMLIFLLGIPVWGYTFEISSPAPGQARLLTLVGGWGLILLMSIALPASIFIAILNYRLWDINLIIRRTLVYALLTASLAGIYFGSVVLLQKLFMNFTGHSSPLVNLITTLIIAALFQPLRDRFQRGANRLLFGERDDPYAVLSKLGRQLQDTIEPAETLTAITATLCQALKLPYAAIILQGAAGERVTAAATGRKTASAREWPLRFQGLTVGWLAIAPRPPEEGFSEREERLLADVASHAGAAAHAAQLTGFLQHSRERLVLAREEERRRIRRDLHDGLGPSLASQTFTLDAAIDLLDSDPRAAADLLRKLKLQNQALVADIRRLVYELRPPTLDELGLTEALGALLQQIGSHSTTRIRFTAALGALEDLPAAVEVAVYRLVQEGVNNVLRHAAATACTVECRREAGWLTLTIRDNGRGIDPEDRRDPAKGRGGLGMLSMRERAEELGGKLTVAPGEPSGTLITALIPIARKTDE